MRSFVWFIPSILVFLGILLLSTVLSVPIQVKGVDNIDKLEHAFAYLVLITTLLFGFYKSGRLNLKLWALLIIGCSVYGMMLELVQFALFPNRYFEWKDAIANVSGAVIGGIVFRIFRNV